jgi:hypothetical protein
LRSPLVRIAAIAAIHGVALLAIYQTEYGPTRTRPRALGGVTI